jgi:peptide/nickel transport system permease protein
VGAATPRLLACADAASAGNMLTRLGRPAMTRRLLRPLVANRLVMSGTIVSILLGVLALGAGVVAPYDPVSQNIANAFAPPSLEHPFGTDRFGRDVLSRTIHGSRISLGVGFTSVAIAAVVGSVLGMLAAFLGGWRDNVISRIVDVLFAFPAMVLAIGIAALLGPGIRNAMVAISIVYAPVFFRVARGATLTERNKDYVDAARALGTSTSRIMRRHVFPNILSPLLVQASVTMALAILIESYLSYLGLGTQPPHPSWGTMLNEGRPFLELAPWTSIFPGAAIMLSVVAFNLLGDGLRDVFDPRSASTGGK